MTAPSPSVPVVHARKTSAGGVNAWSSETMTGVPVKSWSLYATDRPDQRQRYVNINHQSHRILWHK